MSHLTKEQFEDILQGEIQVPDHVDECPVCRSRLAEKRALAQRMRKAFSSVQASSDLADRIRANIGSTPETIAAAKPRQRTILLNVHRRLWSGLAAAAAILIITIPVGLYVNTGSQAKAARTELVRIHEQNLESHDGLFINEDPNELVRYLHDETGHVPAMLCTGSGMTICGCCTGQFQGRTVASYVVKGQGDPISIVVIPDLPKSLGMRPEKGQQPSKRPIWRASCEGCNMASVRIGDRSYCAIGQVAQEDLDAVLNNLLE